MLGYNMFAYCRNNPVCRIDISGTADVDYFDPDGNPCTEERDQWGKQSGGRASNNSPSANDNSNNNGNSQPKGGSNFRSNLQKHTGTSGEGQHAHHVFPKKFANLFREIGINVNDIQHGAWWEVQSHLKNSYEYNLWWEAFFSTKDVTAADAYAVAEFLTALFGFNWSP